jgi:hypothetical protein
LNLYMLNDPQKKTYIAHNGESTIDLIFVSDDLLSKSKIEIEPAVERKHQRVTISLQLTEDPITPEGKRPKRPIRRLRCDALEKHLPILALKAETNMDECYDNLLNILESAADRSSRKPNPNKPWFDKDCRALKRLALSRIGTDDYKTARRNYKSTIKDKRNAHELKEFEQKIKNSRTKPWVMLPPRKKSCVPKVDMRTFEEFYGQLYVSKEEPPTEDTGEYSSDGGEEWYNEHMTNEEVQRNLNRSKRGKAVGPDSLATEILKDNELLIPLITRLFNRAFSTGLIPERWRISLVKPLFKGKGSPEDANNYRCISLSSHIYKLFTSILTHRLITQCIPQMSENQYGFLPGRNCEGALQRLIGYIEGNNRPTYVVFIDFKAAFDNVSRRKLIETLAGDFKLKGRILKVIEAILKPNYLIIDNGSDLSQPIKQSKGVQQGDSISPQLFVMFVNALLQKLEKRNTISIMYADDLAIAGPDADNVQSSLTSLANWCEEFGMTVNTEKSKVMKFRKAGAIGKRKLYLYRKPLELVSCYRYLGVMMQPALGFSTHVDHLLNKTATIIACIGPLQKLPLPLALKIFDIKVMPTITYGMTCISPRLSTTSMLNLDRCKSIYLKAVLGMSRHTSNTFVLMLTEEKTLCESLKDHGFNFGTEAWEGYAKSIEEKRNRYHAQKYSDGPAFKNNGWKTANRTDRQYLCRLTYHGFHHVICGEKDFYSRPEKTCFCIYCGDHKMDRLHILSCTYFNGKSLTRRVREILSNCDTNHE